MTTTIKPATLRIEIEIDAVALLDSVWNNIFRSTSPWISSYSYDWEDESRGSANVVVKYDDGESGKIRQRTVTPMMLAKAFQSLVGTSFWGNVVSADPEEMDAIQADACVQRAIFGKEIYA